MKKKLVTLCALIFMGIGSYVGYSILTKDTDKHLDIQMTQSNVSPDKEWVITFDHGINQEIMNAKSVYVQDQDNKPVPVSLKISDPQTLVVKSPNGGYQKEKTYNLYINRDLDLEHVGNENLPKQYHIQFTTM
ncbi:Ig-like domain-containing protein [Aneurinibacillus migulanus]|uniref:Ig-like domain-containing protein n=1 Tax=Aneurinibacillus migulanus TaxID=47500 RepID=UPI00209CE54D|nr:Ig-like domain-containing protein [Aneurinibacillus migulanus]MCP1357337.1 Ig-like domain-containing protein [Aneurinibacillus migulanus]